jgi:tetraacyldisaccharide 4'-kinase
MATAPRPILLPLSPVYGAGVAIRNWFFDTGLLRSQRVGVPTIAVGNISSGGAGKTPLVEMLARRFIQKGRKVAIISRGYRRRSRGTLVVSNGTVRCAEASQSGDEPAQMASKLTGVIIVVDEQRVRGALYAIQKLGAGLIILDDGFQHRYLRRDADIVIIPVQETIEPGWMIPAGNRREPLTALRRATMIAVSRCETLDQFNQANSVVRRWSNKPVIGLSIKVSAFRRASTRFSVDLAGLKGKTALAFSGIGSPRSFEQTVRSLGLNLKRHLVFPDHHFYNQAELADLERSVRDSGADILVTTEKDIARLGSGDGPLKSFFERSPLFYVEIEQSVLAGASILDEMIDRF